jgi:hypothetical protein
VPHKGDDFIVFNPKGAFNEKGNLRLKRDIASVNIPCGGYARLIIK